MRLAQGGRVGDGLEVSDFSPGEVEALAGLLKGEEGVLKRCVGRRDGGDGVEGGLRLGEGGLDGGLDLVRRVGGPADEEGRVEERIGGHGKPPRFAAPPRPASADASYGVRVDLGVG